MATSKNTKDELAAFANVRGHRLAFVILFEGVGLAFTTSEDVAGISAAWQHSQWQTTDLNGKGDPDTTALWFQTAFIPGTFKQDIEFFNPKIPSDSISFRVADPDSALAASVYAQNRQAARTFMAADLAAGGTGSGTLVVQETAAFAALVGDYFLYIGNETLRVNAADRTATGWSFVTRGFWSFHNAESGDEFCPAHRINSVNQSGPRVTSAPTNWFNRRCRIFLHHYEVGNGWSDYTQALLVWEGVLRNIVDNGDKTLTFNSLCVTETIKTNLFEDQFTAEVAEGMYFAPEALGMTIFEVQVGGSAVNYQAVINSGTAGFYNARSMLEAINALLPPVVSGLVYAWSLVRGDDGKVRVDVDSNFLVLPANPEDTLLAMSLDARVWTLLGFDAQSAAGHAYTFYIGAQVYRSVTFTIDPFSQNGSGSGAFGYWQISAGNTPVIADLTQASPDPNYTHQLKLQNVQGSWSPQAVLSTAEGLPPGTTGYLQFGDLAIVGGDFSGGTFTVTARPGDKFANLGFSAKGGLGDQAAGLIHESGGAFALPVKQIWYERAPVKDLILRLLLSTGTTGYNSFTWDVNPAGMGVAVPFDLLDLQSFLTLGHTYWTLLLTKPAQFSDLLTSVLATHNRFLVWRQGKLTLVEPRLDGPTIAVSYALTNDNKAHEKDRAHAEHSTDGVINRVELKYQRDFGGAFKSTAIFEDVVSSSDFGSRRAVSVEGWGIDNDSDGIVEFGDKVAGKALAFFSRPMTSVQRTIDKTLIQIVPGDTVLLSDPYLVNPKTGARGLVTWPAWVKSASFDFTKMAGDVVVVFNPEIDVDKICNLAPSARVDHFSTSGGYVVVDGTHRYIQVVDTYYSAPGEGNDDLLFFAGDKLLIRELSPADPRVPLLFHVVVASVDTVNHRLFLTATIAGWDASRFYIVVPDDILTVQQSQLIATFVADDATDSTGRLANDSYAYGVTRGVGTTTPATLAQQFVKPPMDGSVDAPGKPVTAADLFEASRGVNVLQAHKTRHLGITQCFPGAAKSTNTAIRQMIWGPLWVPLYMRGSRPLIVRLFVKTVSGTGTFWVTSSRTLPQGKDYTTQVVFSDAIVGTVSTVTGSTTYVWTSPLTLPCYPDTGGSPPGVWVTVEALSSGGAGVPVSITGIAIVEAPAV